MTGMDVDGWDAYVDRYGHVPDEIVERSISGGWRAARSFDGSPIADMSYPVRCTCQRVYDLERVEVTARYADCSMWKAPCCGRQADDRGETGWKTTQDYYPLRTRRGTGR